MEDRRRKALDQRMSCSQTGVAPRLVITISLHNKYTATSYSPVTTRDPGLNNVLLFRFWQFWLNKSGSILLQSQHWCCLLAAVLWCRWHISINIWRHLCRCCLSGGKADAAVSQWDRQTDGRTFDHYIDTSPLGSVNKWLQYKREVCSQLLIHSLYYYIPEDQSGHNHGCTFSHVW